MRLIDADALQAKIMMEAPDFMDGGSSITKAFIMAMIKTRSATPTIDAVPVTRCKDCKYKGNSVFREDGTEYIVCWNQGYGMQHPCDWFCADGEQKDT